MRLSSLMAWAGESSGTPSVLGNCSRPALADAVRSVYVSQLGGWPTQSQLPIVYTPLYNISFYGVEKFHPFDSTKFGKVVNNLVHRGVLKASQLIAPLEVMHEMLLDVHTEEYLTAVLTSPRKVAQITETWAVGLLPNWVVQWKLHRPMRFHVGGTMLALALALQYGWSINLGGGMHHANFEDGSGWCMYSDWVLAMRMLRRETGGRIQKAIIIDLDVHQGNGHERDKLHFSDADLFILDIYNADQWPWDEKAKAAIGFEGAIRDGTADEEYLALLARGLEAGFTDFAPDIVLYNAGTDILLGDPLGQCRVSAEGVAKRDEMVFEAAKKAGVPICMALSGGYAKNSAGVISKCLEHVIEKLELIKPCSKL